MSGETSVGVDPTPPVDPVPQPAPDPSTPGLATEEPEISDEPDIPPDEPKTGANSGPTERQPGSGPR